MGIISRLIAKFLLRKDIVKITEAINAFQAREADFVIPDIAIALLIAVEDKRYFLHRGFDLIGMIRATRNFFIYSRIEGASTIEQQLVRVLTGRREITLARKMREIVLASATSSYFSKDKIAKTYLYHGYYGWRMNGLPQAYERLGKTLLQMSEIEMASLVARLKYPEPQFGSSKIKLKISSRANYAIAQKNKLNLPSISISNEAI